MSQRWVGTRPPPAAVKSELLKVYEKEQSSLTFNVGEPDWPKALSIDDAWSVPLKLNSQPSNEGVKLSMHFKKDDSQWKIFLAFDFTINNTKRQVVQPMSVTGNSKWLEPDAQVVMPRLNKSQTTSQNYEEDNCEESGGTMVQIDWYYQTWIDGVLVYEEYVFSTYECWGVGGGGGGGGGGNPEPSCWNLSANEAINLLNGITSFTSNEVFTVYGIIELPSDEPTGIQVQRQPVSEIWPFGSMNYWGMYSRTYNANFGGVRKKLQSSRRWQWESLQFTHFTKNGNLPPCLIENLTGYVAPPIISSDGYEATTSCNVNVEVTFTCVYGSYLADRDFIHPTQTFLAN